MARTHAVVIIGERRAPHLMVDPSH